MKKILILTIIIFLGITNLFAQAQTNKMEFPFSTNSTNAEEIVFHFKKIVSSNRTWDVDFSKLMDEPSLGDKIGAKLYEMTKGSAAITIIPLSKSKIKIKAHEADLAALIRFQDNELSMSLEGVEEIDNFNIKISGNVSDSGFSGKIIMPIEEEAFKNESPEDIERIKSGNLNNEEKEFMEEIVNQSTKYVLRILEVAE